ncbi:hypothetical protein QBC35DRAFT_392195 [Podospora australis]|uniref:Uncharacterized protein n=1 Tax=Podospora australis TaxID=1536484 RepID=A0AAN6WLM2_9PEZI|nr:hypothetical protein QBC35DRAFT_392195 [Podospora australis]
MVASRRRTATRLGFKSVADFEKWEEEIVIDHFACFICDYLAKGYTIVPPKAGFVEFVDLDNAIEERIEMLEANEFQAALDPDKTEWTAKDHYKQFVVSVVADDVWLARNGIETAQICFREWTAKQTVIRMFKLLEFLIHEWKSGPGVNEDEEAIALKMASRS